MSYQSRVTPKYRYKCHECGSVQLYRILDAATSVGRTEDLTAGGVGVKQRREALKRNYRCGGCGNRSQTVADKKRDGQPTKP